MKIRTAAVVLLACAILGAPGGLAGAEARPLQTGFLDDAAFYNEGAGIGGVWMRRAKAAGASLARLNVYWSTIAPHARGAGFSPRDPGDPAYEWRRLDDSVRNAVAQGLTPILTVLHAPAWAEGAGRDAGAAAGSWRPDPGALADFAVALATRYGGRFPDPDDLSKTLPRVARFQAWNEPNLFYYLTPQLERGRPSSPRIYRSLLNSFYAAVKSVQPGGIVLAAGLAPIGRAGMTVAPLRFMRLLTCVAGRGRFRPSCRHRIDADVWATHPYTTGGPTHEAYGGDDVSLGDLPEMAALLQAADRFRKIRGRYRRTPFWVTEFSWDTSPPDPGGVPMRRAKRWVAEALYRIWDAGASAVVWLTIRDGASPGPGSSWRDTYQSGFYRFRQNPLAGRAKPSLRAFRFPFVALPEEDRIRLWGRTPGSEHGPVLVQARVGGGWRGVATLRANRAGVFHGLLRTATLPTGRRPGALRAWFGSSVSVPFSPRPTRDRFVRPFGG